MTILFKNGEFLTRLNSIKYTYHQEMSNVCIDPLNEEHQVYRGDDGKVLHAELKHGTGLIMLGPNTPSEFGKFLRVPIKKQDYGASDYTCRDLEGHIWTFGDYDPWKAR